MAFSPPQGISRCMNLTDATCSRRPEASRSSPSRSTTSIRRRCGTPKTSTSGRTATARSEERWIKERVGPDLKPGASWLEPGRSEPDHHWHRPTGHATNRPPDNLFPASSRHVYSRDFEMWCDTSAAKIAGRCEPHRYYFTDVPLLVNKSDRYPAKDTIHDPEAGRARHASILSSGVRRDPGYDTNQIFGDQYNLGTPMPEPVIDTAAFNAIAGWRGALEEPDRQRTGLPFIVADATRARSAGGSRHDPRSTTSLLNAMHENDCLGVSRLCISSRERPDKEAIDGFKKTNRDAGSGIRV